MAQQLKRWESPRREGRNHKGRGGSAKARQYKKRQKRLLKKLQASTDTLEKEKTKSSDQSPSLPRNTTQENKKKRLASLFFYG